MLPRGAAPDRITTGPSGQETVAAMRKGVKTALVKIAKVLLGAAIIAYVIKSGRLDFGKIAHAEWRWMLAGWGLLLTIPFFCWLRWHAVLRMQHIEIGLFSTLRIQLIGMLFNTVLMGGAGGDVVKAYYIAVGEGRSKKAAAVVSIVIDRFFGVFGVIAVVGLGLLVTGGVLLRDPLVRAVLMVLCAVYGAGFVVVLILMIPRFRGRRHEYLKRRAADGRGFWRKLADVLDQTDGALQEIVRHPRWAALCVAISVVNHIVSLVSFYIFFRALGVDDVPISTFAVLAPLSIVANGLPFLPAGGLGMGELVASELFKAGVETARAIGGTTMFMWRIGLYLTAPAGLVFFILQRDEIRRAFAAAREGIGGKEGEGGQSPEAGGGTTA